VAGIAGTAAAIVVIDVNPGDEITCRKSDRALGGQRTGTVVRVNKRWVHVSDNPMRIPRDRVISVRVKDGGHV
jgi:hypothetical protein